MKYSLALVAFAATAFAAPTLTPREPERGTHGNHNQANQVAAAATTSPITNAQIAATPVASQAAASSVPIAADQTGSSAPTTGGGAPVPENLVPAFGVEPGRPHPGAADCLGLNDTPIPCFCPPPRDEFIARLNTIVANGGAFGHLAQFPTDNSAASQGARLNALTVTMQNFNNTASGVGCPKAAATFA